MRTMQENGDNVDGLISRVGFQTLLNWSLPALSSYESYTNDASLCTKPKR
jgi:hypothetical protein